LNLQKLYDLDLARRRIGSGWKGIPRRSHSRVAVS
jgi:hypothetical protein